MMTQGGIGMRDHQTEQLFGSNGSTIRDWINLNSAYYNTTEPVFQPDNHVGVKHLWALLNQRKHKILVNLNSRLITLPGWVVKNGTKLTKISTVTENPGQTIVVAWPARVFIDATYEGDLMAAAGASWTFGREARDTYNESLGGVTGKTVGSFPVKVPATWPNGSLIPGVDPASMLAPVGSADDRVMGYSYRLCITKNEANKVPFPVPEKYNPQDFELIRRYYKEVLSQTGREVTTKPYSALGYRGYPPGDKFDVCDDGTVTPITTDKANGARGYPNGTLEARNKTAEQHKYYVGGLFHFLLTDPAVPKAISSEVKQWGLCKDEWLENGHWPPQLYVREAGRLVGDRVYSQNDRQPSSKLCRNDSIAVADWSIDIHIMARTAVKDSKTGQLYAQNEGQTPFGGEYETFQFELPYSVLLPKRQELTNLLVPNCPSVSHVVFSAIREEPTLWQLGRASGVAAVLAVKNAVPVQDVQIRRLQNELLKQKAVIHWPERSSCDH